MTIQTSRLNENDSAMTRTSSGLRRANPTWQTPIPNPARSAANCARSLSLRKANMERSTGKPRARTERMNEFS